jgi:4-amino-4-deoxy-L-arabinose transferase-like glycosyltransferase
MKAKGTVKRLTTARALLAAMMLFQLMWLAAGWLTGVVSNWRKLTPLLLYTVVVGGIMIFLAYDLTSVSRRFRAWASRNHRLLLLGLCLVFLLVGVAYARSQRIWRDEKMWFRGATIVAEQGVTAFFDDYAKMGWLARQHPPLAPLLYGLTMRLTGVDLFYSRLVSLALGLGTILITYSLAHDLYEPGQALLATLFLVAMPLFLLQATAAMSDMPVTFFFTLTLFLTLRLVRTQSYWLAATAGVSFALGLLSKYTMVLFYPVLVLCYVAISRFRRSRTYLAVLALVPVALLAVWVVLAYRLGLFGTQMQTVGMLTQVSRGVWGRLFLLDNLLMTVPSSIGVYNIPLIFLGLLHAVQRRDESDLFLLVWVVTVAVLLTATLPGHRYFMPIFPGLAILMAHGLERLPQARLRTVTLALLYCAAALYLFVDWKPVGYIFIR